MAITKSVKQKKTANTTDRFQSYLCAGILDLCRLVKLPGLKKLCKGARTRQRPPASSDLCPVPAASQLAVYLRLLAIGITPAHEMFYPHREQLRRLLEKISTKATRIWDYGDENNTAALLTDVRNLAEFAHANIAIFKHATAGLDAFGVKAVSKSLPLLDEKIAANRARAINKKLTKNPSSVPAEIIGLSLIASATSPGVVEKLGTGMTIRGLMRFGVRTGLSRPATPGLTKMRNTLRRAGLFLAKSEKTKKKR